MCHARVPLLPNFQSVSATCINNFHWWLGQITDCNLATSCTHFPFKGPLFPFLKFPKTFSNAPVKLHCLSVVAFSDPYPTIHCSGSHFPIMCIMNSSWGGTLMQPCFDTTFRELLGLVKWLPLIIMTLKSSASVFGPESSLNCDDLWGALQSTCNECPVPKGNATGSSHFFADLMHWT